MTSLFEQLPEDMIQEILESCPESTINIALASKQLCADVHMFANLFIKTHYKQLKPSTTGPLLTYAVMLDDELFCNWGVDNSTFENELAFVTACGNGNVDEAKYIYCLGVDVDVERYSRDTHSMSLPNALEKAILKSRDEIVEFLVDRNVCCYTEDFRTALRFCRDDPSDSRLKIISHLCYLYSRYGKYDDMYDLFLWVNNHMTEFGTKIKDVMFNGIAELIPYGTMSNYSGVCQKCACNIYVEDLYFCAGALKCVKCK